MGKVLICAMLLFTLPANAQETINASIGTRDIRQYGFTDEQVEDTGPGSLYWKVKNCCNTAGYHDQSRVPEYCDDVRGYIEKGACDGVRHCARCT